MNKTTAETNQEVAYLLSNNLSRLLKVLEDVWWWVLVMGVYTGGCLVVGGGDGIVYWRMSGGDHVTVCKRL